MHREEGSLFFWHTLKLERDNQQYVWSSMFFFSEQGVVHLDKKFYQTATLLYSLLLHFCWTKCSEDFSKMKYCKSHTTGELLELELKLNQNNCVDALFEASGADKEKYLSKQKEKLYKKLNKLEVKALAQKTKI